MNSYDPQTIENTHPGDVSELADEHDLGSCAERREGSIPSVPTHAVKHSASHLPWRTVPGSAGVYPHPNPLPKGEGVMENELENRKDD